MILDLPYRMFFLQNIYLSYAGVRLVCATAALLHCCSTVLSAQHQYTYVNRLRWPNKRVGNYSEIIFRSVNLLNFWFFYQGIIKTVSGILFFILFSQTTFLGVVKIVDVITLIYNLMAYRCTKFVQCYSDLNNNSKRQISQET